MKAPPRGRADGSRQRFGLLALLCIFTVTVPAAAASSRWQPTTLIKLRVQRNPYVATRHRHDDASNCRAATVPTVQGVPHLLTHKVEIVTQHKTNTEGWPARADLLKHTPRRLLQLCSQAPKSQQTEACHAQPDGRTHTASLALVGVTMAATSAHPSSRSRAALSIAGTTAASLSSCTPGHNCATVTTRVAHSTQGTHTPTRILQHCSCRSHLRGATAAATDG